MLLKRKYDHDAPTERWTKSYSPCPVCKGSGARLIGGKPSVCDGTGCEAGRVVKLIPPVVGVEVLHAGDRQNFSPSLIRQGQKAGWLTFEADRLTILDSEGDPVTYKVVREPGSYCCHCGEELPDASARDEDSGMTVGQLHVAERHAGETSPDPNNPSGYRRDDFYACEKE